MSDVYIVDAVRTPLGKRGGGLAGMHPADLEVAALSAGGDPLYRTCGEKIGRGFVTWGAAQLAVTDEAERVHAAAQLLVQVEGSVLLRSLGLDDVVENALKN